MKMVLSQAPLQDWMCFTVVSHLSCTVINWFRPSLLLIRPFSTYIYFLSWYTNTKSMNEIALNLKYIYTSDMSEPLKIIYFYFPFSECRCNPYGSQNRSCNRYHGRCHCHENVIGRQCDRCQSECKIKSNNLLIFHQFQHF